MKSGRCDWVMGEIDGWVREGEVSGHNRRVDNTSFKKS
jgi:hypothetical protein